MGGEISVEGKIGLEMGIEGKMGEWKGLRASGKGDGVFGR